jgi:hypothetical protein
MTRCTHGRRAATSPGWRKTTKEPAKGIRVCEAAGYCPRNPQSSDYYRCVEDYFQTFVQLYEERFKRPYGFWQPYIQDVIYRFLNCDDLHHGLGG